jgi:anaerobic selenocysteine-containing dehydrogenase
MRRSTTRHAHVILPPTAALEREHYDLVFHVLAIRNTAKYSPPLFPKAKGAKHDWEILLELTRRLRGGGIIARFKAEIETALLRRAGPRGLLDQGLKAGPYAASGLSIDALEAAPHGIDLGPLAPSLPERLRTDDKRIRLAPVALVADIARVEAALERMSETNGALSLVGRRELRSNNSWMHNSERLMRGRRQCTLFMHPADVASRGLTDGERVRVSSRVGAVEVELEATDAMMLGVVSMPHGWGHGRAGSKMAVAAQHAGASINDLTDDLRIDTLTGNAGFSGVPVHVHKASSSTDTAQ